MSPTANWSYPTAIRFGAGRIKELAEACSACGITKPLLITDKGLAGLPITTATLNLMEEAGLGRGLFSEVDPNPTEHNLAAGIAAYQAGGHNGVISATGGPGPTPQPSPQSSQFPPRRAPDRKWAVRAC
jgi:alcohol dehydrogenase class IV